MTSTPASQIRPVGQNAIIVAHVTKLDGTSLGGVNLQIFLVAPDGTLSLQPGTTNTDINGDAAGSFSQLVPGKWGMIFKSTVDGQSISSSAYVTFV